MHPGPYLALVLMWIAAMVSARPSHTAELALLALALAAVTATGWPRLPSLVPRLAAAAAFVVLLAAGMLVRSPLGPQDAIVARIGPVHFIVSRAALGAAALVAVKAFLALLFLTSATAVLGERQLLAALQAWPMPSFLTASLFLTVRYLHFSTRLVHSYTLAAAARAEPPTVAARAGLAAHVIGALVVRGFEHSERIGWAMVARGFDGRLPLLLPRRASLGQWALALAGGLAGFACLMV